MWEDDESEVAYYDVDQVCLNGHVINDRYNESPQNNKKHCPECGELTITQCINCHADIPGYYNSTKVAALYTEPAPSYCHNCGKPYPWTENKLKAAKELIELQEQWQKLGKEEQASIEKSLADITKDTPQATVGATRLNKLLVKIGSGAGDALKQIFVDVASETAKKVLLG